MYKIISLNLARMIVTLVGTGTSQNVPHITDSITYSRSKLSINSKGVLTADRLSQWLPHLAPRQINNIYIWLIRNNIIDDNLYVSEYYLNNKIKVLHQLSQVFDRNIATNVSYLLEEIINEVRLPRNLRDYRMNAHALIRLEKPQASFGRAEWDGILIDIPPVFPISFLRMVMEMERLLRHPRLSSKVKNEIKRDLITALSSRKHEDVCKLLTCVLGTENIFNDLKHDLKNYLFYLIDKNPQPAAA